MNLRTDRNLISLLLLPAETKRQATEMILIIIRQSVFSVSSLSLNAYQSLLIRSAYMTSFLSNKSILFRSSLHWNRWILNLRFYIWKEHSMITPSFQKRTFSTPQAMQRVFQLRSQRICLTCAFKEITDSSSRVDTFQIQTVYGILSECCYMYRFCKRGSGHHS